MLKVIEIHRTGGFEICNRVSNSKDVLQNIPAEFGERFELAEESKWSAFCVYIGISVAADHFEICLNFDKLDTSIIFGQNFQDGVTY